MHFPKFNHIETLIRTAGNKFSGWLYLAGTSLLKTQPSIHSTNLYSYVVVVFLFIGLFVVVFVCWFICCCFCLLVCLLLFLFIGLFVVVFIFVVT